MPRTRLAGAFLTSTLLCIALRMIPSCAEAQESNSEGSLEVGLWKRLSSSDQLYLPFSITRAGETDHADALAGVGYDRVLSATFQARLGYRYLWELSPPEESTPFREHRGVAELFVRTPLGTRIALLDRTRFELRRLDAGVSWRLRNRLRAGRLYALRHERTITPYASFEAGYDSRYRTVNRLRFSLGAAARLSSRFIVDLYGARSRDTRDTTGPPDSIGATLNFYL